MRRMFFLASVLICLGACSEEKSSDGSGILPGNDAALGGGDGASDSRDGADLFPPGEADTQNGGDENGSDVGPGEGGSTDPDAHASDEEDLTPGGDAGNSGEGAEDVVQDEYLDPCDYEEIAATASSQFLPVCKGDYESVYSHAGYLFTTDLDGNNFEIQSGNGGYGICDANPETCERVTLDANMSPSDYPLNRMGVWSCQSGGLPFDEWIGFSQCLESRTGGYFLVGMAGDNHVRLKLDGRVIYQNVSNLNFRAWNVMAVSLKGGRHVMELLGKNDGSLAAFGAEVWGPYDYTELESPEAMAETYFLSKSEPGQPKLVFTTEVMRADNASSATHSFDVSEEGGSGYSCPEGYALNLCGESPTCVKRICPEN